MSDMTTGATLMLMKILSRRACLVAILVFTSMFGLLAASPAQAQGAQESSDPLINKIFTSDMLGAQVAYLEAITGPAWKVYQGMATGTEQRIYKVDQCQVTVIASNGAIQSLGMDLTDVCTVDLNRFVNRNPAIPPVNSMTFGQFGGTVGTGSFASDCLEDCGNSYDPSVYDHYVGPQADNNLEIAVSVKLVDTQSIDASEKWDTLMDSKSGSDYVQNTSFNCDGKYDLQASGFFKNIKVTSIAIGTNLPGPWSTCKTSQ